jgi:hypothetical protein
LEEEEGGRLKEDKKKKQRLLHSFEVRRATGHFLIPLAKKTEIGFMRCSPH